MSEYLKRAAELLDQAAIQSDRYYSINSMTTSLIESRERIARGFALLGAIEKGVLPASVAEDLYAHLVGNPTLDRPTRQ